MLSYKHAYHAGNFADVLKHAVLVEILEHLIKKDAGFDYIDTHSGAGVYTTSSKEANKTQEHNGGIGAVTKQTTPELKNYFERIRLCSEHHFKSNSTVFYPGSPAIAQSYLRPQDKAWLFELHTTEFRALKRHMNGSFGVSVKNTDGLVGLQALIPPKSRRGLILIDPSYEVKTEFQLVVDSLKNAYKKFSTGVYALWYPVVERWRIDKLEKQLINSGIKDIQLFELAKQADSHQQGMTAAGMIIINAPWQLHSTLSNLLPALTKALASDDSAFFRAEVLVGE